MIDNNKIKKDNKIIKKRKKYERSNWVWMDNDSNTKICLDFSIMFLYMVFKNKEGMGDILRQSLNTLLSLYYPIIILYCIIYKHYNRLYDKYNLLLIMVIVLHRYKCNKHYKRLSSDNNYYVTQMICII